MNIAIYGLMMIIFIVVPFIAGGERLEFSSVLNDLYKFLSMMSMGAKVLLSSFYLSYTYDFCKHPRAKRLQLTY